MSLPTLAPPHPPAQVVLPEGAKDARVSCDLPHQLERDTQITYLDVMGR